MSHILLTPACLPTAPEEKALDSEVNVPVSEEKASASEVNLSVSEDKAAASKERLLPLDTSVSNNKVTAHRKIKCHRADSNKTKARVSSKFLSPGDLSSRNIALSVNVSNKVYHT
jgi:hypothetical protein